MPGVSTITRSILVACTAALVLLTNSGWCLAHEPTITEPPECTIADLFQRTHRRTQWNLIVQQPLEFDTFHPQGLTKANEKFYLSTVEKNPTGASKSVDENQPRSSNYGLGHLICFDALGQQLHAIQLGEGAIYHPGGIDRDSQCIWVPVAEYRPDSSSIIYRINLSDLSVTEVFRFSDHIGAVIRDLENNQLIGLSWGGRRIYRWTFDQQGNLIDTPNARATGYKLNPQHYIDYQDCQFLSNGLAVCSGLASYTTPGKERYSLGGIDLIELESFRCVHQLPVELYTERKPAKVMTQNPCYLECIGNSLRFHFIPEDNDSQLYVYELRFST